MNMALSITGVMHALHVCGFDSHTGHCAYTPYALVAEEATHTMTHTTTTIVAAWGSAVIRTPMDLRPKGCLVVGGASVRTSMGAKRYPMAHRTAKPNSKPKAKA